VTTAAVTGARRIRNDLAALVWKHRIAALTPSKKPDWLVLRSAPPRRPRSTPQPV